MKTKRSRFGLKPRWPFVTWHFYSTKCFSFRLLATTRSQIMLHSCLFFRSCFVHPNRQWLWSLPKSQQSSSWPVGPFDSNLVADLIVTYFDQDIASLASDDIDTTRLKTCLNAAASQSPFAAYGMRSPKCRTALVASAGPMLTVVSAKLRKRESRSRIGQWQEWSSMSNPLLEN